MIVGETSFSLHNFVVPECVTLGRTENSVGGTVSILQSTSH